MPDWKKIIEDGIPKAEANYEALCNQAFEQAEKEREQLRRQGMTEAEIDAYLNGLWGDVPEEPEQESAKRGVEIDWENQFAVIDGETVTFAKLDRIITMNENFVGKRAGLEAVQRFWKLSNLAKELKDGNSWVIDIGVMNPQKNHRGAGVWLDIDWMAVFRGKDLRSIESMFSISDVFGVSGINAGKIRFSFDIKGVWSNA
jgi:hypothetical protein